MNFTYTINPKAHKMFQEPAFSIFKHEGLWCCLQRIMWTGNLNGYVGVGDWHPWYGKSYDDNDVDVEVHGGITYASDELHGIEDDVLGKFWWFGFDTIHSRDQIAFENDVSRRYRSPYSLDEYRDFEYVKKETISLATQLLAVM